MAVVRCVSIVCQRGHGFTMHAKRRWWLRHVARHGVGGLTLANVGSVVTISNDTFPHMFTRQCPLDHVHSTMST